MAEKHAKRRPARPWTDADQALLLKLHGEGKGRNEIARIMKRSPTSIRRYGDEAGLSWDQTRTAVGVQAQTARMAELRQELALETLLRARKALHDLGQPATRVELNREGEWVEHQTVVPAAKDQQALATVAGICIQRHGDLVAMNTDQGTQTAVSLLEGLVAGLRGRPVTDDTDG